MSCRQVLTDNWSKAYPFPASVAIGTGDLLWWDSGNLVANSAINRADKGSLVLNQRDFQSIFLGVMQDVRLATETSTGNDSLRGVILDGIFDVTCASQSWEVGDLVGIDRSATPANYAQQVNKVQNPALAIGNCVKRTAGVSVTTVRCRLTSSMIFDVIQNANLGVGGFQGQNSTTLTDAAQVLDPSSNPVLNMVPTAARIVKLPVEAQSAGLVFYFSNNSGGAFSVTFQTSAAGAIKGNGVVPQNKTAIFWYDTTLASWVGLVSA